MAVVFFGVAFGAGGEALDKSNVLVQGGTTGRALELAGDNTTSFWAASGGRNDVLEALENIKNSIIAGTWPPI